MHCRRALVVICALASSGAGAEAQDPETKLAVRKFAADAADAPKFERGAPEDVLVAEGFESERPAITVQTYFKGLDPKTEIYARTFDRAEVFRGKASLRVDVPKGEHNAVQVIDYRIPEGADRLFLRTCLRFPKGFQVAPSCELKLIGLTAEPPPERKNAAHRAGEKPNGTDYFSARLGIGRDHRFQMFTYHPEQIGGYADHIDLAADVPWGKWVCLELEVRANTVEKATPELLRKDPAAASLVRGDYVVREDGAIRVWIDGRTRAEARNVRFRHVPDLKLRRAGSFPYFGGAGERNASPQAQTFLVDDFAVSRSYLGPPPKE
jgi:hypothetical protein